MDKRVTVNVPDAPPDEHDGEDLLMSVDERDNLMITVKRHHADHNRPDSYELLALYARGYWADARIEDLEV